MPPTPHSGNPGLQTRCDPSVTPEESPRQTKPKKGPKRKVHEFRPFLWILVFFLRKTCTIHIEFLFRNAPAKSSWTDLFLVWFAGATPESPQRSSCPKLKTESKMGFRGLPAPESKKLRMELNCLDKLKKSYQRIAKQTKLLCACFWD